MKKPRLRLYFCRMVSALHGLDVKKSTDGRVSEDTDP